MNIIADLQLHSRFARACSKYTTLDKLEEYARIKGINLLSTGDFQHPLWNKEIKNNLNEDENGILWSKNKFPFLWGSEISLMYSDGGRRAVHLLMFAPNGEIADQGGLHGVVANRSLRISIIWTGLGSTPCRIAR